MTARTSPRPSPRAPVRATRGENALVAQYLRELSSRDENRRRTRRTARVRSRGIPIALPDRS
jgi:hypothetical protein